MRILIRNFLKCSIFLILSVAMLSSCHSSKKVTRWEDPIYARKEEPKSNHPSSSASKAEQKVIDAACAWIGVPYKYGGNTRSGVDCSGLVCMAFETGAGIKLPRSSHEQAQWCKTIARNKAKPGDLMFFSNQKGGRINHVAIYLGDGRVVHSTSSRGVIISSLDESYWSSHYHSCGRVF